MAKKKARVSLCMIVRDEEATLARCLDSAKPWVDELVVVDTGSADRTREIAAEAGAVVVERAWTDDFAAARNASIEAATGDWLVFLDADEVLTPEAGRQLREQASRAGVLGAYVPLRDQGDNGRETVSLMFRAVRKRPDVRWRYRIHEQILPDVLRIVRRQGGTLPSITGEILHDGYKKAVFEAKGKRARNLRLYEAQLADTPRDVYMLYKYGDFLRRESDDPSRTTDVLERAFEALQAATPAERREYTFGGELCALVAIDREKRGENEASLEASGFGLANCRNSANLDYVHGMALLRKRSAEQAEQAFRRCREAHAKPALIPAQPHITGTGASLGIARALGMQRRWREAADEAWDALEADPSNGEAISLWADLDVQAGDWSRATARLIERVKQRPECAMSWFKGGELFFRLRLFDKAVPWLLRAAELGMTGPAYALAGEALLNLGHHEAACDVFLRGVPDARCRAGVLILAIAYKLEARSEDDCTDADVWRELRRIARNLRETGEDRILPRLDEAAIDQTTDALIGSQLEVALR